MVSYFKPGLLSALFLTADQLFENLCKHGVLFAAEGPGLSPAAMHSHTIQRARWKCLKAKLASNVLYDISLKKKKRCFRITALEIESSSANTESDSDPRISSNEIIILQSEAHAPQLLSW